VADGQVKIGLDVTGIENVKDLKEAIIAFRDQIRAVELQFKKGNITSEEGRKAYAAMGVTLDQLRAKSQRFGDVQGKIIMADQALWHANNRVELGFKSLATEVSGINNKMGGVSDKLRQFYREQRVGDRTMREGVSTIQMFSGVLGGDIANGVGAAANAFQQAEFTVNGLGIAAQSAGGKIATLGTSILAISAPITVAAAAMSGGILLMNSMKEETKDLDKAIYDLRVQLGLISKADQWAELQRRLEELKDKQAETTWKDAFTFGLSGGDPKVAEEVRANARKRREKELLELQKEIEAFKKANELVLDEVVSTGKSETEKEYKEQIAEIEKYIKAVQEMRMLAISTWKKKPEPLRGVKEPKTPETVTEFTEGEKAVARFEQVASRAMGNVGNTIGNTIGRGFVDAFGIAHTLLGQFIEEILAGLAKIAIERAVFALLDFAFPGAGTALNVVVPHASGGMLYNPIVGVDTVTGRIHTFAERGPERVIPTGQLSRDASMRGGGDMQPIVVNVHGNWQYDRLAWATDRGNQIRALRSV